MSSIITSTRTNAAMSRSQRRQTSSAPSTAAVTSASASSSFSSNASPTTATATRPASASVESSSRRSYASQTASSSARRSGSEEDRGAAGDSRASFSSASSRPTSRSSTSTSYHSRSTLTPRSESKHSESQRSASAASSASSSQAASSSILSSSTLLARAKRILKSDPSFAPSSAQHQQYPSSRLVYVPMEILRCTAEERSVKNLLQPGKNSYWSTASGQNHEIVFKITTSCLLGFLKLSNRSCSHVEVYISHHDIPSQYVRIHTDTACPHGKVVMYPTGFMPCKFVKMKCVRGTPSSAYSVQLVGVLERNVWREMGPELGSALIEHPESLLLPAKPHLPAQISRTFPSAQIIVAQEEDEG